jgi:hypothetical protein
VGAADFGVERVFVGEAEAEAGDEDVVRVAFRFVWFLRPGRDGAFGERRRDGQEVVGRLRFHAVSFRRTARYSFE